MVSGARETEGNAEGAQDSDQLPQDLKIVSKECGLLTAELRPVPRGRRLPSHESSSARRLQHRGWQHPKLQHRGLRPHAWTGREWMPHVRASRALRPRA